MRIYLNNTSGQTVLEAIIAISIIVIGIISLIALLTTSISGSQSSFNESIAMHLGREAAEGARYIRDSNWLKMEDGQAVLYSNGLRSGTDYTAAYIWAASQTNPDSAIQFNFTDATITDASGQVYTDLAGRYRQSAAPLGTWTATQFRRWVTLYPICFDTSTGIETIITSDGSACPDLEIGIQVIAQVQWDDRGGAIQNRYIETRLYNWKYPNIDDFPDLVF